MRWNFLWFVCVVLVLPGSSWAADWPGWRGPTGDGIAPDKKLPIKWSSTENVRWKLDLPGPGDSSPIVWGNRIFITQSLDAKGTQRALFCIDRAKGAILWKKVTDFADKEPIQYHPFCSATPVTDGRRVVACFGSAGLVCYDFEGQELWRKDLGKLHHIWGRANGNSWPPSTRKAVERSGSMMKKAPARKISPALGPRRLSFASATMRSSFCAFRKRSRLSTPRPEPSSGPVPAWASSLTSHRFAHQMESWSLFPVSMGRLSRSRPAATAM
jgi:hypothetical protein